MAELNMLDQHYSDIQSNISMSLEPGLGAKVVAAGNVDLPFHGWFQMKEAYSPEIISEHLDANAPLGATISVLDPFTGSGTTGIALIDWAERNNRQGVFLGAEINPFLRTLSQGKLAGRLSGTALGERVRAELFPFLQRYRHSARRRLTLPSSTLKQTNYFNRGVALTLQNLGDACLTIEDIDVRAIFQIAVCSSIEPSSRLRRDGRALRYMPNRKPGNPEALALQSLKRILRDLDATEPVSKTAVHIENDAKSVGQGSDLKGSVDWTIFSPPYPNNIDYTEVYKLENWVMGGWSSNASMLSQRRQTLRSHPTADYGASRPPLADYLVELVRPITAAVPNDMYSTQRKNVIEGYAVDMHDVLVNARQMSGQNGRLTCVVGNSLHGTTDQAFVIAADLLVAEIASHTGWVVTGIRVARRLRRRHSESEYLRESLVECVASPA